MKVLITGCDGQLGRALLETAPSEVSLLVTNKNSLDITNSESCQAFILNNKPDQKHIIDSKEFYKWGNKGLKKSKCSEFGVFAKTKCVI